MEKRLRFGWITGLKVLVRRSISKIVGNLKIAYEENDSERGH